MSLNKKLLIPLLMASSAYAIDDPCFDINLEQNSVLINNILVEANYGGKDILPIEFVNAYYNSGDYMLHVPSGSPRFQKTLVSLFKSSYMHYALPRIKNMLFNLISLKEYNKDIYDFKRNMIIDHIYDKALNGIYYNNKGVLSNYPDFKKIKSFEWSNEFQFDYNIIVGISGNMSPYEDY